MKKSKKIKILFCGARWLGINCLKELLKLKNLQIMGAVVPKKDEAVWWKDVVEEREVKKMGIPLLTWQEAEDSSFDLIFSVYHRYIFKKDTIDRTRLGIINLHPMPLPQYRGKNGPAHAIINHERRFGATLHYVNEDVDTGPIIDRIFVPIGKNDTGYTLYLRTQKSALLLFRNTIRSIIKAGLQGKRVPSTPQKERLAKYYSHDSLDNKEVDLSLNRKQVYDFVRALQFPPFEPAYFVYKGKRIHLTVDSGKIILE